MKFTDNGLQNFNISIKLSRQTRISNKMNAYFGKDVMNIVKYTETTSNTFSIEWSVCYLPNKCTSTGLSESSSKIFTDTGQVLAAFSQIFPPEYKLDEIKKKVKSDCSKDLNPPTASQDPFTINLVYCGGFDFVFPKDLITDKEDGDMRSLTLSFESPKGIYLRLKDFYNLRKV